VVDYLAPVRSSSNSRITALWGGVLSSCFAALRPPYSSYFAALRPRLKPRVSIWVAPMELGGGGVDGALVW
jgi:hypothetical protein